MEQVREVVAAFINEMRGAVSSFSSNSKGDTTLQNIKPLSIWDNAKYRTWISDMERYFIFADTREDRKSELALVTTTGYVGEFISGILSNDRYIPWKDLKSRLGEHCNDAKRPVELLTELAKINQRRGEKMREYIQRVVKTAEGAFDSESQGHEIVRNMVRDFFIEGIYDDDVKMSVLRGTPRTTEEAYELAATESLWKESIRSSHERREEPMEICHTRGKSRNHRPPETRYWGDNRGYDRRRSEFREDIRRRGRWDNDATRRSEYTYHDSLQQMHRGPPPPRYANQQGNYSGPTGRELLPGQRNYRRM